MSKSLPENFGTGSFSFRADAHCDTITALKKDRAKHINLDTIEKYVDLQCFALYISEEKDTAKAVLENDAYYQYYCEVLAQYEKIIPIHSAEDIKNLSLGSVGALLCIENAEPLAQDSEAIFRLMEKGYRSFGITWSNDNSLAGGVNTDSGITDLGRERLQTMNRLPLIVDLAHMNRRSFFQAMDILEKPPIVTHSCCHSLCPHPRNLEDDAMKLLAEAQGVMGITFVKGFLREDGKAMTDHIVDHMIYAADCVGIDKVICGSDFDGTDLPLDMEGQKDMPLLVKAMEERDFRKEEIDMILGENLKLYLEKMLG